MYWSPVTVAEASSMYGPAPKVRVPSSDGDCSPLALMMSPTTSSWVRIWGKSGFGLDALIVTVSGPVAVNVSPARNGDIWPADFTA